MHKERENLLSLGLRGCRNLKQTEENYSSETERSYSDSSLDKKSHFYSCQMMIEVENCVFEGAPYLLQQKPCVEFCLVGLVR